MTNSRVSPADAARELLGRRQARENFEAFCDRALDPLGLRPAAHHRLLIRELEVLARTPSGRLLVMMPPGAAKSSYTSVLFPAWYLAQGDGRHIIGASHSSTLAEAFSRRIQGVIRESTYVLRYTLTRETAEEWSTSTGGEYLAAGVGGWISGRRADLAIIDDPVKSREAADSDGQREKVWQWYLSDLTTRLKPSAQVALVMTRWHEDDLAGRLLLHQQDSWRVVKLPAVAGADDPVGRAEGEPLWSDDGYGYGVELFRRRAEFEASGDMRSWWALYQQEPRSPEGLLFEADKIVVTSEDVPVAASVRAWDFAGTEAANGHDPDWTVGVRVGRLTDDRWIVDDVVRLRGGPLDVEKALIRTAQADGRSVMISLPQDPGQAGKMQSQYFVRCLAGFRVQATRESGSKETRAQPAASQVNAGNVVMRAGPWNRVFREELRDFPGGRHDDQVDAFSRAFGALLTKSAPVRQIHVPFMTK